MARVLQVGITIWVLNPLLKEFNPTPFVEHGKNNGTDFRKKNENRLFGAKSLDRLNVIFSYLVLYTSDERSGIFQSEKGF